MQKSNFKTIILAISAILFLAACSSEEEAEMMPPVLKQVKEVRAKHMRGTGMIRLEADVIFDNPNARNMLVTDNYVEFYIDGTRVGVAETIHQRLRAGTGVSITVATEASIEGVLMATDNMVRGDLAGLTAAVALRGPIKFARDTIEFNIELEHDQAIKLPAVR